MLFDFTVEEILQKSASHEITPNECRAIWFLVSKQDHDKIFCNLLTNPMCTADVLKLAFADYRLAKYAMRNPSLDIYVYRDKSFIDKTCVHFINAMFENNNSTQHESLRFVPLALKVFAPEKIIKSNIILYIDEFQKKRLALDYLKDIKESRIDYGSDDKPFLITDIAIQMLKYATDENIIQAIYNTFPNFNIDVVKLFAANENTSKEIIDDLLNQLSTQVLTDKNNLYYDQTLRDLLKHPNCNTQPTIKMTANLEDEMIK